MLSVLPKDYDLSLKSSTNSGSQTLTLLSVRHASIPSWNGKCEAILNLYQLPQCTTSGCHVYHQQLQDWRFQVRVELLSSLHHLEHITRFLSIPYQRFDQCFITLHFIWKSELPVIEVSIPLWGLINSPVVTNSPHFAATPDFGALRTTNKHWFRCFPFPRKLDRITVAVAVMISSTYPLVALQVKCRRGGEVKLRCLFQFLQP